MEFLLAFETLPFMVALAVMLGLTLLEGMSLLLGGGLSNTLESLNSKNALHGLEAKQVVEAGQSIEGIQKFLSFFCLGKIPVMVLLILFLTSFGLTGLILQAILLGVTGKMLNMFLGTALTFLVCLPLYRQSVFILAPLLPKDESEAISYESLIGLRATITLGRASRGNPAEAKVIDPFGKALYIMVEPEKDHDEFDSGTEIILFEKKGSIYLGLRPDAESIEFKSS